MKATKKLPGGVEATVVETPSGKFVAEAQSAGGKAVITWKFPERPHKIARPGPLETGEKAKEAWSLPVRDTTHRAPFPP